MAKENFPAALARVLVYEGGFVNDPHDPGGATNQGVTQATYNVYRSSHKMPGQSVRLISSEEVADLYRGMYWNLCRCDDLPAGIDFAVFDAAVNSGPGAAGKWLQQALGADYTGQVDGLIGRATVDAVNAAKDDDVLVAGICGRRLATLQRNRNWSRYGKGWGARIANVVKIGQAWAAGSVGPAPVMVDSAGGHQKAPLSDTKKPLVPITATAVVAGVSTAGGTLTELAAAFAPIQSAIGNSFHWLAAALGFVGASGATLTALGHTQLVGLLSAQHGEAEVPQIDLAADAMFVSVPVAAPPIQPAAGAA